MKTLARVQDAFDAMLELEARARQTDHDYVPTHRVAFNCSRCAMETELLFCRQYIRRHLKGE